MSAIRLPFTVLVFAIFGHAYTTWETNCILPQESVNFVSSPNTRGTLDIVWSCFAILVTCTWTVQHLAVPVYTGPQEETSWIRSLRTRWASSTLWHWRFLASFHPRCIVGEEKWHKWNWMWFTLLAPEYILGKALAESCAAQNSVHDMADLAVSEDFVVPWSSTHGFLANMRGLVLRFDVAAVPTDLIPREPDQDSRGLHELRVDGNPPYEEQDPHEAERRELVQCRQLCGIPCRNRVGAVTDEPEPRMRRTWGLKEGGEMTPSYRPDEISRKDSTSLSDAAAADAEKALPSHESDCEAPKFRPIANGPHSQEVLGPHKKWKATWALSSAQWYYAYSTGIITQSPQITVEDIKDRSKADALVKLIAVSQIIWLVIQIIARAFQSLAITLLEITVLAFAACAIITYLLLLPKPKDVQTPFIIDIPDVLTRAQIIGLAARASPSSLIVHQFWLHGVAIRAMADNIFPPSSYLRFKPPFLSTRPVLSVRINAVTAGIGLGGVVFGSVHIAAWDFAFPTAVEKTLWRVSCILLAALPLVSTLVYWAALHVVRSRGRDDTKVRLALKYVGYAFAPFYLVARVYLAVEVFRALAYPPLSTFETVDWNQMLPHGS